MKKQFKISAGSETLAAMSFVQADEQPHGLILHGAGKSSKERRIYLMELLLVRGVPTMAFDFSGCGSSSGEFNKGSLKKRVAEASLALSLIGYQNHGFVLGASMSGYITIKLLEHFPVKTIVLFAPAMYDAVAYAVPFDERFTETIRRPDSWRDSDAYAILEKFKGNLLICIGADDQVIPSSVIELLDAHSIQTARKEIIRIPGCPHAIDEWLQDHPESADAIADKIVSFL